MRQRRHGNPDTIKKPGRPRDSVRSLLAAVLGDDFGSRRTIDRYHRAMRLPAILVAYGIVTEEQTETWIPEAIRAATRPNDTVNVSRLLERIEDLTAMALADYDTAHDQQQDMDNPTMSADKLPEPRPHTTLELTRLRSSYEKHGPLRPIVYAIVDGGEEIIIDGHLRLQIDPSWPRLQLTQITTTQEAVAAILATDDFHRDGSEQLPKKARDTIETIIDAKQKIDTHETRRN